MPVRIAARSSREVVMNSQRVELRICLSGELAESDPKGGARNKMYIAGLSIRPAHVSSRPHPG